MNGTASEQTFDSEPLAACLEHMEALSLELQLAMEAVAANAAEPFRSGVVRQQQIADKWAEALRQAAAQEEPPSEPWRDRLEEAARTLRRLNREYAALVEHSGRSTRMLAQLCERHRTPAAQQARWSVNA
jgi:hypothetical protein